MPEYDMTRAFNLGVGTVFIIDKKNIDTGMRVLKGKKGKPFVVGGV